MKALRLTLFSLILTVLLAACAPIPGVKSDAARVESGSIETVFTQAGQKPEVVLQGVIRSAQSTLDVAIYSLTHPDIVKALVDAKKRGVQVRVITDQQEAKSRTQAEALKILREAGIPVKVNSHHGLMHLKMTIADSKVATTGSFNYTKAAATVNDEMLVVIRDPAVARAWKAEFDRMWREF